MSPDQASAEPPSEASTGGSRFTRRYSAGVPTGSQTELWASRISAPTRAPLSRIAGTSQSRRSSKISASGHRSRISREKTRTPVKRPAGGFAAPAGVAGRRGPAGRSDRCRSYRSWPPVRLHAGRAWAERPLARWRSTTASRSRSSNMSPAITTHSELPRRKSAARRMPPPVPSGTGSSDQLSSSVSGMVAVDGGPDRPGQVVQVDHHLANAVSRQEGRATS